MDLLQLDFLLKRCFRLHIAHEVEFVDNLLDLFDLRPQQKCGILLVDNGPHDFAHFGADPVQHQALLLADDWDRVFRHRVYYSPVAIRLRVESAHIRC